MAALTQVAVLEGVHSLAAVWEGGISAQPNPSTAPTQGRGHGHPYSQLPSLHHPACPDPVPFPFGRGIDLLAAMGWIISQELGFLLQPGGCPS